MLPTRGFKKQRGLPVRGGKMKGDEEEKEKGKRKEILVCSIKYPIEDLSL